MKGFGSHDQRRAHGVEGKFLKVVAGLLGKDLVDHESLVAPPGCFELAGRAQPQLRVAVHGEPGRAPAGRGRGGWRAGGGLSPAPRPPGRRRAREARGGERAPGAPAARLDPPADQHLRGAFLGQRSCQSARASCGARCRAAPRGVGAHPAQPAGASRPRTCTPRARLSRSPPPASRCLALLCQPLYFKTLALALLPAPLLGRAPGVCAECARSGVRAVRGARAAPARGPGLGRSSGTRPRAPPGLGPVRATRNPGSRSV